MVRFASALNVSRPNKLQVVTGYKILAAKTNPGIQCYIGTDRICVPIPVEKMQIVAILSLNTVGHETEVGYTRLIYYKGEWRHVVKNASDRYPVDIVYSPWLLETFFCNRPSIRVS